MNILATGLRSALFYVGYVGSLIPYASVSILFCWLLPLKARYRFVLQWNRFVIWWLQISCGIHYRFHGLERVPKEPCVLISNHQSPWETLFFYYQFWPTCGILKRELLRIPFFGWALRLLKPVAIDRSDRRSARTMLLEQGRQRLQMGFSMLVFPEGTRVDVGEERKYSVGGIELAISAGVKVVPLVHDAGRCWPAHRFLKKAGTIDIYIGEAIETQGREPRELTRQVEEWTRRIQREGA